MANKQVHDYSSTKIFDDVIAGNYETALSDLTHLEQVVNEGGVINLYLESSGGERTSDGIIATKDEFVRYQEGYLRLIRYQQTKK